jgi:hypothetical protein
MNATTRRVMVGGLLTSGVVAQASAAHSEPGAASGLVRAGDLLRGDLLLDREGLTVLVEAVEPKAQGIAVYRLRGDTAELLRGPGPQGVFPQTHQLLVLQRGVPASALAPITGPSLPAVIPDVDPTTGSPGVVDGGRP